MSGSSYDNSEKRSRTYERTEDRERRYRDDHGYDAAEARRQAEADQRRADEERKSRLAARREEIRKDPPPPPPKTEPKRSVDARAVRKTITRPKPGVKRVHVVLIDNSGSNEQIAAHFRRSSDYLTAVLKAIDPESQIAFIYFSDHCDGERLMQSVDYVSPDPDGAATLFSTTSMVYGADGDDQAEAIECALHAASGIDFGEATEKHLYLVTDQVAHGMGLRSDNGCPLGRSWETELHRARQTYTTFEVIGCGTDPRVAELQAKFISKNRLRHDFIDLSAIQKLEHRLGITGNALLFLIARQRGLQTAERFLAMLYEKWLDEPIFGANTDLNAREAIRRFIKYLEVPEDQRSAVEERVIPV